MTGLVAAGRNPMLAGLAATVRDVSLHHGDPGLLGAQEADGPFYARQRIHWTTPAGAVSNRNDLKFSVPAGVYDHVGYWSAAGDFLGSRRCPQAVFTEYGVYSIPAGQLVEDVL